MPSPNLSIQADHSPEISIQLLISGQVQGVGFRAATERQARLQQLRGWVRNRFDGRVEVVIEGSPAAVETMVSWCHHGDPPAQVIAVEQIPHSPEGFDAFTIRPTLRG